MGQQMDKTTNVMEVHLAESSLTSAERWETLIEHAAKGRVPVFTDGCVKQWGSAGFGWAGAGCCGKGRLCPWATSTDCEIAGIRDALEQFMPDSKIIVLSDSTGAIAGLVKAGKTGRARTPDIAKAIQAIRDRQQRLGEDAVVFAWVKGHAGIEGNELADAEARMGAEEGDNWGRGRG